MFLAYLIKICTPYDNAKNSPIIYKLLYAILYSQYKGLSLYNRVLIYDWIIYVYTQGISEQQEGARQIEQIT